VDFGIAKLLDINLSPDDETHQRLTHTGDIFGSPLYMSPEQCSGQESDRRSDIYSMGCLMRRFQECHHLLVPILSIPSG
jgi:serine/threonine-protein kinase